jgi:hypothetical protein
MSVADTLPKAFKEWYVTGKTIDHEQPVETCQLCEQEELRYHFEIQNQYTERTLRVGSRCILKFDIAVYEGDKVLDKSGAKCKLNTLMQSMRHEYCLKVLHRVAEKEKNDILDNALEFYRNNKYLTPKQAFVVIWRLQKNQIDYSPSFFKVSLRKEQYRVDLRVMPSQRVHMIWPVLSSNQRKLAIKLGHPEPDNT